jgi:hypothetical protein
MIFLAFFAVMITLGGMKVWLYRCDSSILSNFRRFSNYLFGIELVAKGLDLLEL